MKVEVGGSSRVAQSIVNKKIYLEKISNGIDYSILDDFVRVSKKLNCFIWCSKKQIYDIMKYFFGLKDKCVFMEVLCWVKTNPIPQCNNTWLSDIEYCLYFREKGVKYNDGYKHKHKAYVSSINAYDKELYKHPTIKPLPFVKENLLHVTQENDVILDPFCGSGTTCLAAKETGRRYIGFEYNEEYWKIANNRLNGIDANGQMSIFTDFENV